MATIATIAPRRILKPRLHHKEMKKDATEEAEAISEDIESTFLAGSLDAG
jgi:hypothetical protein